MTGAAGSAETACKQNCTESRRRAAIERLEFGTSHISPQASHHVDEQNEDEQRSRSVRSLEACRRTRENNAPSLKPKAGERDASSVRDIAPNLNTVYDAVNRVGDIGQFQQSDSGDSIQQRRPGDAKVSNPLQFRVRIEALDCQLAACVEGVRALMRAEDGLYSVLGRLGSPNELEVSSEDEKERNAGDQSL